MIDILKTAFMWVLVSSFTGSILAVAVILIQKIFKNRISSRVCVILWILVFIRLAVTPFAPGSQISIFNIFNYEGVNIQKENTIQQIWEKPYFDYNKTENSKQTTGLLSADGSADSKNKKAIGAEEVKGVEHGENSFNPDICSILSIIWALGFIAATITLIYSGWHFSRQVKNAKVASDLQLLSIIDSCRCRLGIGMEIPTFISNDITIPCITGVRRPKLVIPRKVFEFADYRQITHICMHELSHFKRRDNLINLPVTVIGAIHWFNPVLWYALKQFNLAREISCDAHALEALGQEECIPYGMTLINFTRFLPPKRIRSNLLGFCETNKQIERRIIMIKTFKKGSNKISVGAIVLCLVLGSVTLTNAADSTAVTDMKAKSAVTLTNPADSTAVMNVAANNAGKNKFRLNDPNYFFYSLDRAQNFSGFTFKVPDFLPSGYELHDITISKNTAVNNDIINLNFVNPETKYGKYITILTSKKDLIKGVKYVGNEKPANSYKEESMEVAGISGTCLTKNVVHDKPDMGAAQGVSISVETESVDKYFLWDDSGVWYGIKYNSSVKFSDGRTYNMSISNDDLKKIVSSMKQPKEIQNVNYVSERSKEALNIYDETDLEQASKMLGFEPKFPHKLPKEFNLCFSQIIKASYKADPHKLTPYTMEFVRSSNNADLWLESTYLNADKTTSVEFDQVKSPLTNKIYNYLKKNKYIEKQNQATKQTERITVKALQISGTEILSFRVDNVSYYVWMQNDVFYQVQLLDNEIKDMGEILKVFITQ